MTKLDVLKKYRDIACNNMLAYSKNYLMNEPDESHIKEWNEAIEEVRLLEELIVEQEETNV